MYGQWRLDESDKNLCEKYSDFTQTYECLGDTTWSELIIIKEKFLKKLMNKF